MKGRKLLSAVIAGAMVLGTMSFPAFAADTLPEAVDGVITLTEDVKLGSDFDYNANGGSLTIDLAGYSLKLTGNTILKNGVYTIKNGTVDVENVECTSREGLIRIAPHSDDSATLNMDNVTVKANGYNAQCGLFQFETPGKLNLNKVTINAANVTDGYGVFYSSPGNPSSLTMNEVTMTVTGANKLIYGCNAVITDSNISAQVKKDVFSAVSPVITDSTLTVEAGRAVFNDANVFITTATVINSTITPAGTLTSGIVNNTNASSKIILDSVSDIGTKEGVCTASAAIGTTYYATLEEALAAAQKGDTITLLANAEPTLAVGATVTKATTIDLNGKTLTINSYNLHFGEMTFKNGTINVGAINASKDGVFWQWDPDPLTFDNVTLNANEVTSTYLISENNGSDINIINGSVINVNPQTQQKLIVFCFNGGGRLLVDDSEINISNVDGKGILYGDITIKGNSEVNIATTKEGIQLTQDAHSLKIEENAVVTVANPTEKTRNAIQLAAGSAYSKADTATVNAVVDRPIATDGSNIAKSVKLAFEATEDANVYDIYVVPTDSTKAINRLSTAEMTFDLDADATSLGMTFDITGADNVNVQRDENDHVLFNFNGVNQADASGVEVKLGKVTFDGYGTFTFTVVPGADNEVQTAKINDNIVNTYTSEADTFVLGTGISGEVKVPTQKLTINIDFPNAVNDNVAAYQDMTVTVTGSNYNKEVKLGEDETAMVDGAYEVVIEGELVKDNSYTVTVSGAGYRTARYTVTMTDDKILNFWNNAKNNDAFIEDNEDNSKRKVTFLAGELVRDNQINIYDLSAVVSYFGEDNFATTHPEYVKYDLNRDGKIDSKDIAYVLVSWGK